MNTKLFREEFHCLNKIVAQGASNTMQSSGPSPQQPAVTSCWNLAAKAESNSSHLESSSGFMSSINRHPLRILAFGLAVVRCICLWYSPSVDVHLQCPFNKGQTLSWLFVPLKKTRQISAQCRCVTTVTHTISCTNIARRYFKLFWSPTGPWHLLPVKPFMCLSGEEVFTFIKITDSKKRKKERERERIFCKWKCPAVQH